MSQTPSLATVDTAPALLRLVNDLGGPLLTMREEGPLFECLLTRLSAELAATCAAVYLHEGQQYVLTAFHGNMLRTNSPVAELAMRIERLFTEYGGTVLSLDGEDILLVPLVTRGAPMGALAFAGIPATALDEGGREALRLFGQLLASGLRERRLQALLDAAQRKLQQQQDWVGDEDMTDPLTGLANQLYFLPELERVVAEGVQTGGYVSLLRVEIDRYKAVVEAYGPPLAEAVLRRVAQTVQGSIRGRDLGVRFADDHFYILLPLTPGIGAVVVAERLRDRLSVLSFEVPEGTWHLTVSIGVACLSNRVITADDLLAKVQRCLVQSKFLGGNQVFFDWDEALESSGE